MNAKRLSVTENYELVTFLKANPDFCAKHWAHEIADDYNKRLTNGATPVRWQHISKTARRFNVAIKGSRAAWKATNVSKGKSDNIKIVARALLYIIDPAATINDKQEVIAGLREIVGKKVIA